MGDRLKGWLAIYIVSCQIPAMSSITIAISGIEGRMGREILAAAERHNIPVLGALERAGSKSIGKSFGAGTITDKPLDAFKNVDAVIDFSSVESVMDHAEAAATLHKPFVTGVTGLDAGRQKKLKEIAAKIPVFYASNMSIGIYALRKISKMAAEMLPGFDIEILDLHHGKKADAPSGTAMTLAEDLRDGKTLCFERHGQIGARPAGEVGVQTLRGGDVVGEHTVYILGAGERLELTHRATSRALFAEGAIQAARFIVSQKPGLYGMDEMMGAK